MIFMKNGIPLVITLLFIPVLSFAHGSHGSGFIAGFTHPIFGFDHSLAILGIGILGPFLVRKSWYLLLISFWIPMVIGGILGVDREATLIIEKIIALSVIAVGILISFGPKNQKYLLLGLMAFFGFFHGFAHGAEMPETTTIIKYISGYSVGTILLFLIGYFLYSIISKIKKATLLMKVIGGFLIGAGAIFMFG